MLFENVLCVHFPAGNCESLWPISDYLWKSHSFYFMIKSLIVFTGNFKWCFLRSWRLQLIFFHLCKVLFFHLLFISNVSCSSLNKRFSLSEHSFEGIVLRIKKINLFYVTVLPFMLQGARARSRAPCGGVYSVLNSENFQLNQKVGTLKTYLGRMRGGGWGTWTWNGSRLKQSLIRT